MKLSKLFYINAVARGSFLSRAQVAEVAALIPQCTFRMEWIETRGDKDQTTSLRQLEKTDFFTHELDQCILHKQARIAIHSAKDLPDPLPIGLRIALLTSPVDTRDCLVMKQGFFPFSHMLIATSSLRREQLLRTLLPEARFIDLRGSINERLKGLDQGVDGIVVAAAALIRLSYIRNFHSIYLPGPTAHNQGRLAVICHTDDEEMIQLLNRVSSI